MVRLQLKLSTSVVAIAITMYRRETVLNWCPDAPFIRSEPMSTSPPTSSTEANQKTPLHKTSAAGKSSIHAAFLEQTSPDWLINATPARRAELKAASAHLPHWYQEASVEQKQILQESFAARFKAQTRLDKTMSALLDVEIFAARLLVKALKERFAVCLLYTSPSPRDGLLSRMPSSA